ncbi:MAG: glycoside hydrolase family 27 protein [Acidobacteria bacterium]|nr:glycoside hydrolase family 27 protein [Acidobacteriota bacterium]
MRSFRARRLGLAVFLMLTLARVAGAWPPSNRVPPMGWEPWNFDHCGTMYKWDEQYYKRLADFFVTSGLRNLGYKYLTIECNDHYRDQNGQIQPNLHLFPHGFQAITEYIHKRGLKVRTYTDAGKGKCGNTFQGAGSLGHYDDDVHQWIKFGFDGVKIDWCGGNSLHLDPKTQYLQFADAMKKSGHTFCVEICSWGRGDPWEWGRDAGTFWRTSDDIDNWDRKSTIGGTWQGLLRNIDANRHPDPKYVGPGKGWNYPDMLEVGVPGGLNETEERTQFSMWAIMAAPLFLGNDVFNMPRYAREIVMNKEVIAVDQDPLGIQGNVVKQSDNGELQVWAKELKNGSKAVALLNRDATVHLMTVNWIDLGISGKWRVRDLWEHRDKGTFASQYSAPVPSHGTVLLELSPLNRD